MNLLRNSGETLSASGSVHFSCLILSRISSSVSAWSGSSAEAPSAFCASSFALKFATSASSAAWRASWSLSFFKNFSVES